MSDLIDNLNEIKRQKDTYIIPSNLKENVTVYNVTGDVIELAGQTKSVTPTTSQQIITPDNDHNALTQVTVGAVTSSIDNNIQSENIKDGVEILGVTGTLEEGIDTSDANATASDILLGKTAYVNNVKITGTYSNNIRVFVQDTEPTSKNGIWIESSSYTYEGAVETNSDTTLTASNINILRNSNSIHNYSTKIIDSDISNGLSYEFDGIYITDSNNDVLYNTNVYYGNGTSWVDITPQSYEIVPFATATDAQISKLLNAHYAGTIDLSTIWNVGDTRVIHLDAMSAPVAGSNKAHAAQDMTFRIIGFNHDNLTTSIGNKTKAAVTIECRELLGNYGTGEYDFVSGSSDGSTYENPSYFNNAYRRTWLNNDFVNALPSTFNTLIKQVVKRNLQGHSNTIQYTETNDKAFLLSYPEVFSSTYQYYRARATLEDYEGTQYAYYSQNDSNAGRIKYVNNNGLSSGTAYQYWLRSPASSSTDYWCTVNSGGSANVSTCFSNLGLAPALAI